MPGYFGDFALSQVQNTILDFGKVFLEVYILGKREKGRPQERRGGGG